MGLKYDDIFNEPLIGALYTFRSQGGPGNVGLLVEQLDNYYAGLHSLGLSVERQVSSSSVGQ